jgi:hypothetical protein
MMRLQIADFRFQIAFQIANRSQSEIVSQSEIGAQSEIGGQSEICNLKSAMP